LLTNLIFPLKKNTVQAFTGQVFVAWPVLFFWLFFPGATGGATLQVVAPRVTASFFTKGSILLKIQRPNFYFLL